MPSTLFARVPPLTFLGMGDPPQIHAPRRQPRDLSGGHCLSPASSTYFCASPSLSRGLEGERGILPEPRSRLWGNNGPLSVRWEALVRVSSSSGINSGPALLVFVFSSSRRDSGKTQLAGVQT